MERKENYRVVGLWPRIRNFRTNAAAKAAILKRTGLTESEISVGGSYTGSFVVINWVRPDEENELNRVRAVAIIERTA